MPRSSNKKNVLDAMGVLVSARVYLRGLRIFLEMDDDDDDDLLDMFYLSMYLQLSCNRYIFRPPMYRRRERRWESMLHDNEFFNENEFLAHFRLSRPCFGELLTFCNSGVQNAIKPVHHLALLKFLGSNGNDATNLKNAIFFGLSAGTFHDYVERAMSTLFQKRGDVIRWPDLDERHTISSRILRNYGFPNCIGIVDGTFFPLEFKPTENAVDYFTRKGMYAIQALIFCDDEGKIRELDVGSPGSLHDNRVWSRCPVLTQKETYFQPMEYILGDSAFKSSDILVPPYKRPFHGNLDDEQVSFNAQLSKIRVKVEHCIGVLKARFQVLKKLRVVISSRNDHIRINRIATAAVMIHNLMIKNVWEDGYDEDEFAGEAMPPNDEMLQNGQRREQVRAYVLQGQD